MLFSKTLLLLCSVFAVSNGDMISEKGKVREGKFTVHYDKALPEEVQCQTVIMIGVGTAMGSGDYNILSSEISSGQPIVTVITDHSAIFVKTSSGGFAKLYNKLTADLGEIIPICQGKSPKILVGAHSASGMAAIGAMKKDLLQVKPDGFIGLDPFKINERRDSIDPNLPTLEWGFAKTTCSVKIQQAAKPAYKLSSEQHRVFYRIDNASGHQNIQHCSFTDKGCAIVCGRKNDGDWVRPVVAKSIHAFIGAIETGSFDKEQFILPEVEADWFELFVGAEEPK
jgi:hypothetical protein